MQIKKAYKFRFYPCEEQIVALAKTFGCARFAYNYMLRIRTDAWMQGRKSIGYHETSSFLTALKKTPDHQWLNEVSSVPLQQALRNLQSSFSNFFSKRTRYPRFKTKGGVQSVQYTSSAFKWDGKNLILGKMNSALKISWSRTIPKAAKVTTVIVSLDTAGRYFVSLLCDDTVTSKPAAQGKIGIDLGLSHFATLSTGEKISAPNIFRKNESKLAKLQRRLSKKAKGSNNRNKARLKVARLHAKIADTRRDFLHKLSTRLINENQVIAVESLSIANMKKNRHLSKSISDAGWGEFIRQLEYKAKWYGRELIGIDKWYPSSKRCSDCGYTISKLPLNVRAWKCPECGSEHDRDINAARNILAAGMAVSAHGETVSPVLL